MVYLPKTFIQIGFTVNLTRVYFIVCMIALISYTAFKPLSEEIRILVDGCLACDSLVVPNSRFASNISETLRIAKKRAIIYWVIVMGNSMIYAIYPRFMPGKHYAEDLFVFYGNSLLAFLKLCRYFLLKFNICGSCSV